MGLPPIDGITGCFPPNLSNHFAFSFVPTILIEVILCLFMLYKAWVTYKNDYSSVLLELLIQDRSASLFAISLAVLTYRPQCTVFFQVNGYIASFDAIMTLTLQHLRCSACELPDSFLCSSRSCANWIWVGRLNY
jgi:hypothetical protein